MAASATNSEYDSEQNPRSFCSEKHPAKLLEALNQSRHNPLLCDGIVVLGNKEEIHIQKNVLSAASHYFKSLFFYGPGGIIPPKEEGKTNIDLSTLGITRETFEAILDYVYTSRITLSADNIEDILQAADLLLLTELKEICCEYLEQCIAPHNCIGIRAFSARYFCQWVHVKATNYLDEHFREVSYNDEFLRLPVELLTEILQRNTLNVKSEDEILECILRWTHWNLEERVPQALEVVKSCIRPADLRNDNIKALLGVDKILPCDQVLAMVAEMRKASNRNEGPRGMRSIIVFCGGEGELERSSRSCVEVEVKRYVRGVEPAPPGSSAVTGHYIELKSMNTPRIQHGLVEVGGCLYAIGGRNRKCEILNSGEKYDPHTNTWTPIPPMEHARVGFGLVAIDDNIYAVGGSNDMTDPLTSVEKYNIFSNKWTSLPDLPLKRVWSAYAAVDKKIYVIAGGVVGKFFEAVECFDTKTHAWVSVCPMRERRASARAIAIGDEIYVFGGFRRIECPSVVHSGHSMKMCASEVYSVKNDHWATLYPRGGNVGLCTMSDSSLVHGLIAEGSEIFVVGHLDVGQGPQCIRAFNRRTQQWRCVIQNAPPGQRTYECARLNLPLASMCELSCTSHTLFLR